MWCWKHCRRRSWWLAFPAPWYLWRHPSFQKHRRQPHSMMTRSALLARRQWGWSGLQLLKPSVLMVLWAAAPELSRLRRHHTRRLKLSRKRWLVFGLWWSVPLHHLEHVISKERVYALKSNSHLSVSCIDTAAGMTAPVCAGSLPTQSRTDVETCQVVWRHWRNGVPASDLALPHMCWQQLWPYCLLHLAGCGCLPDRIGLYRDGGKSIAAKRIRIGALKVSNRDAWFWRPDCRSYRAIGGRYFHSPCLPDRSQRIRACINSILLFTYCRANRLFISGSGIKEAHPSPSIILSCSPSSCFLTTRLCGMMFFVRSRVSLSQII